MWKQILAFALGAGVGVFGSYRYFKKKYESISNEEIASVKRYYKENSEKAVQRYEKAAEKIETINNSVEATDTKEEDAVETVTAHDILMKHDYTMYSSKTKCYDPKPEEMDIPPIRVISNREWDRDLEHNKMTITWYAGDEILADEDYEMSIEETIGSDALSHFSEYEEDVVFVRNDLTNTDYEVIKDYGYFSDR